MAGLKKIFRVFKIRDFVPDRYRDCDRNTLSVCGPEYILNFGLN